MTVEEAMRQVVEQAKNEAPQPTTPFEVEKAELAMWTDLNQFTITKKPLTERSRDG